MVSHPENGSDSPIGSDRDRGRDNLTLLISCVENIKRSKNKTFVNLYGHTCPVVKRNDLEDCGKQGKKKDLELSTLLYRKISLI